MLLQPPNQAPTTQSQPKYTIRVDQFKHSFQTTGPGNRMNHSIAYYNEQLFIFGGTSATNSKHDEHFKVVFWYSFGSKLWSRKELDKGEEKLREKEKDKERERQKQKLKQKLKDQSIDGQKDQGPLRNSQSRSFMATCRKQHKFYLFGGSNNRNESTNQFLAFDLKKYEWEILPSHNTPPARQSAYLIPFLDNYILLYGGIDVQKCEIFDTFHYYKIDTGVWREVEEGNYRHVMRPRYLTSLCSVGQGQKMFLFGGQFRTPDGMHTFLSDFYEINASLVRKGNKNQSQIKTKSSVEDFTLKVDCLMLKAHKNLTPTESSQFPQAKSAHKLLALNQQYIILLGGANYQYQYFCHAWVYNICNKIWKKIEFDISIPKQAGIDCCIAQMSQKGALLLTPEKSIKQEIPVPVVREPKQLRELKQYTGRRKDRKDEREKRQREKERQRIEKQKNQEVKTQREYNSIYIYGGLNCYDSLRCDMYRLEFQPEPEEVGSKESIDIQAEKMQDQNQNQKQSKTLEQLFHVEPLKQCLYCSYPKQVHFVSKTIIESFTTMIPYPFNAIGLFLENAHNNNALQFCVAYRSEILQQNPSLEIKKNTQQMGFRLHQRFQSLKKKIEHSQQNFYIKTQPFLHISDDNSIQHLPYEELRSSIKNFQYMLHFTYYNIEKKVRVALQRQHQLHEFGAYIKVGALRLGNQFIYLSKGNEGQIRIFAYLLAKGQKEPNYQFCSYVWSFDKKKIIEEPHKLKKIGHHHRIQPQQEIYSLQFYEYSYNKINQRYQKYINDLYQSNSFDQKKNHLLIFHLRQTFKKAGEHTSQLFPHLDTVDICYTPYRKMAITHAPGIYESIDLSMRAYMSCYFLKSQFPKMFIKINNLSRQVASQICLESFDLMAKNRCIYEIDNSIINIEVKLMELYFNPVLTTSMISFHNGILLYHRGRLVARHACPIGQLYKRINNKSYNYFHLFGLLEVPEPILPNLFRTDFIYNVMMEKLRSRLKFMERKLILDYQTHISNPTQKNTGQSNSLLSKVMYQDKTMKITKKISQTKQKQKNNKKEDVEFNPNIKY